MRLFSLLTTCCFLLLASDVAAIVAADARAPSSQPPVAPNDGPPGTSRVSTAFFAGLERLARLVDITYCVGTTGISPPFSCPSRCKDFPDMRLASTWNTGVLMSDSCGYIAVDHEHRPASGGQQRGGGAIVVAFRGTYSITNTVVDLSTVPQEYVPYPEPGDGGGGRNVTEPEPEPEHKCANCTVHMGFLQSWRQARKLVLPMLKSIRLQHPDYPVHLVGHSLGGAVAALAALELRLSLGVEKLVVTTFGEPQTGNKGFVRFLDKVFDLEDVDGYDPVLEKRTYRRVTHVNDPVPLLPLTEWGYRSHAGEVFITKSNLSPCPDDLVLCRGDTDPRCIAGEDGSATSELAARLTRLSQAGLDADVWSKTAAGLPNRLKLWQLFFAHRDYFWRLGLCVPGGDPSDWSREPYNYSSSSYPDEL